MSLSAHAQAILPPAQGQACCYASSGFPSEKILVPKAHGDAAMRRPPNTVGGVPNPTPGRNDPCRAAADASSHIAACCPGLCRSDPHVVLVCAADALQDVDESVSVRSQWLQLAPPLLMKVCGWLASRSLSASGRSAYAAGDRPPAPADSLREKRERRPVSRIFTSWSNGALLNAAEDAGFDVLLTTDRRLRYQQNLGVRRINCPRAIPARAPRAR